MLLAYEIKSTAAHLGCCYSFFDRPFFMSRISHKTTPQKFFRDSRVARKICQGVFFSLIVKKYICLSIIGLLLLRSPPAISRLVVTIIIDAINCVFNAWPLTHIGQKVLETSFPSLANRNPLFFIMRKGWVAWISTSSNGVLPRRICWRFVKSVFYWLITSARLTRPNSFSIKNAMYSTNTFSQPHMIFFILSVVGNNLYFADRFSGEIAKWAPAHYNFTSHEVESTV